MSTEWYYYQNSQRVGPVEMTVVQDLVAAGQLRPSDLVWKNGMSNWTAVREVPELIPAPPEGVFPARTPPAPQFYYNRSGNQFGPFSGEELKRLAASGQLLATDLVRRDGTTDWVSASRVRSLPFASTASESAPATSPSPKIDSVIESASTAQAPRMTPSSEDRPLASPVTTEPSSPLEQRSTDRVSISRPSQAAPAADPRWHSGRVKFFDMKSGFGYIIPEDGSRDVRVNWNGLTAVSSWGLPGLFTGQLVEYQVNDRGIAVASGVRSKQKRYGGVVISYSARSGSIRLDDQSKTLDVQHSDIEPADRDWKRLWPDEPVELSIDGNGRAIHVLQVDQRPALFRFADERSVTFAKFEHLARVAEHNEEWDYRESPTGTLPILDVYIHKTFEQLLSQNKILFDEDDPNKSSRACFNTGLVTELQEELLGVFVPNERYGEKPWTPRWRLEGFFTTNDRPLSSFRQTEFPLAKYFTSVSELYLDPNETRITVLWKHIMNRLDRFPDHLQTVDAARGALERAFRDAMRRLARNYKTVVPQFYEGEIQLLLPVALADPREVDRALVLRRQDKIFEAATIFYLDWAYESARVLAKPDKEWLHPVRVQRRDPVGDEGEAVEGSQRGDDVGAQAGQEVSIGAIHTGRVTGVTAFGVFCEIQGEKGMCHISKWSTKRVVSLDHEVRTGDTIRVKVIGRKPQGLELSRRAAIEDEGEPEPPRASSPS